MTEIIFVVFIALYYLTFAKVSEWTIISDLGYKSETPEMFLRKPRWYHIAYLVLFLIIVIISFFTTLIAWYICITFLIITSFTAVMMGRIKAFNNYRKILHEMVADDNDPERKAWGEAESRKTNKELMDKVRKRAALSINLSKP